MHYIIPDIWIDHNVIHFIVTSEAEFTADLFGFNALTMTRLQRQCSSDGDRYPPKKSTPEIPKRRESSAKICKPI